LTRLFRRVSSVWAAARAHTLHGLGRATRGRPVWNRHLDPALSNQTQGVCSFDGRQQLILANRRYAEIYNLPADAIHPAATLAEMVDLRYEAGAAPEKSRDQYLAWRESIALSNEPSDTVVELENGRVISINHRPMPNHGWIATYDDITERREAEARLARMARHDVLTGLPNRVLLREGIVYNPDHHAPDGSLAVLCLDLDHFGNINDTFGHLVGDALLRAVAQRLRANVRDEDILVRLGSDGFAIVQIGTDQPHEAALLAERLIEAFSQPFQLGARLVTVATSVGIAFDTHRDIDVETLLGRADMALHRAKADGRGIHRIFEPIMNAKVKARHALEMDLRIAVANAEFELFFQPILNAQTQELRCFEALVRWRHTQRGLVPPMQFIPLAEEIDLIVPLGDWIIQEACRQAATWPSPVAVSVNLSAAQFKSPHLLTTIRDALTASGLAPERLKLELTETVLLHDPPATLKTLDRLHSFGLGISLDDFGTGYSSVDLLRSFSFDAIKIDRPFIRALGVRSDALTRVRTILDLGHKLGMPVIAEGVETTEQLSTLQAERCHEVQGYLFSPPLPAADVLDWIGRSNSTIRTPALTQTPALTHGQ
jgi:diguanylate cyclase (GGDEF)-like protein